MRTLQNLIQSLNDGSLRSQELVEQSLNAIEDPNGEGKLALLSIYGDQALALAKHVDTARAKGWSLPKFAGIPMTIKDLFDNTGEVTRAGSHALDDRAPATTDAPIVRALRDAGFIIIGKTNMTEFAFSGLGINAHYGTPRNPFERNSSASSVSRNNGRVPGGSSSGAAVSVSDKMVAATIGTDTGGSCRIPAAFCGIVGFKPTSARVSTEGAIPLSTTLDSIGPLANTVQCCASVDAILSGTGEALSAPSELARNLRVGVIQEYTTDNMDSAVSSNFSAALSRLSAADVHLTDLVIDELNEIPVINKSGGIVGAEAFAWHRDLLLRHPDRYDPWVKNRIESAAEQPAADYVDALHFQQKIKTIVCRQAVPFDVLAMPTVQIVPPTISSMLDDIAFSISTNLLCLKNTAIGNLIDHPAISIPCHEPDTAPTGFMLMATRSWDDGKLLSIASALESIINPYNQ